MVTARQKVLIYFSKTRTASAREISRSLKMSPATVRHHLRVLVADGRLEISFVRSREGRGRPEKVYSLPRSVLGNNLAALGDAVLSEAGAAIQMEMLAKRLAGEANFSDQPIARRLNASVDKLNQMNYHARWEAGPQGPRLIFGHCPYAALIGKHPELCRMDLADPAGFAKVLGHTLRVAGQTYWTSAIGELGPLIVGLPIAVYVGFSALFVATLALDGPLPGPLASARRGWLALGAGLSILAVFVFAYAGWNKVGAPLVSGVQGRYLTPILPLLVFALPARSSPLPARFRVLFIAGVAVTFAATVVAICGVYYR